jgi:TolB-like protein/class 3 adenylate cyclase
MDPKRPPPAVAWRFDRFTLDLARGALLGPDGAEVPLRPKSFALLRLLVENAGRLLDRDAIMAAVWPEVVVGDESITQCVRDVRKALGDEAQQLLKTVPKRGYLLAAQVTPAEITAPASRVERRLAAILAADVAGYSRLMERDEAGTVARLKAIRQELVEPVLARHGGRFVDLKGDGAIVEFGSAVAAVEAAVAIQRAMAEREAERSEAERIRYRIGINLGDVVVDGPDIYGDGVNVAARIEGLCEPGGVWVAARVYDPVKGKLDVPFEPAGRHRVKNISEPVETWRVRLEGGPARRGPVAWAQPGRRLTTAAVPVLALLLLLAAAGTGAWWFWSSGPAVSGKPGIAVLPLANLGGDEATGRLADGITEDIITDLARFRELDVIARNSTEVYKGKAADVRQVGKELGVGYVLEGSIQRQDDRVRVTAQLIDTKNGAHVWSERWDRPVGDVFAVQTEVAEQVASTLGGHNVLLRESVAAAKRKRPADLGAYDLWALAAVALERGKEADLAQGLAYVDAAIVKDPGLARAYVKKAWLLNALGRYRQDHDYNGTYAEMERLARKALEIDPYDAEGHLLLAFATSSLGRNAEALAPTERALELNPSSADVINVAAANMAFFGKPEEGAKLCDRSFRLNPRPPPWYDLDCQENYFFIGRFQDVLDGTDRWAAHADLGPHLLVARAASQAELGRAEAAAATMDELERRFPEASFEHLMNIGYIFEREQEQQQILASARKAGVRVCATEEELKRFTSPRRLPECEAERAKAAPPRT